MNCSCGSIIELHGHIPTVSDNMLRHSYDCPSLSAGINSDDVSWLWYHLILSSIISLRSSCAFETSMFCNRP
jgi:hypothetical protein